MSAKKIAASALLSALGAVILAAGSFIRIPDIFAAALAGFAVVTAVIELRGYYPVLIYFTISLFSLLVLPDKYPVLIFIFFGGVYPMFKASAERFHGFISWSVKFSMFNIFLAFLIVSLGFLSDTGFLPPADGDNLYKFLGNFKIIVFAVANSAFLLYDIAMSVIINLYIVKIRGLLGLKNYF
ncbi:MAG: hypothetical protein FWH10_04360 [Oscillospiraceae bacterium]|nr:hypothetical protein [Oscillospiraceae bacterium]